MIKTMKSQKLIGWQKRLQDLIHRHAEIPFKWGKNDCITFAADAIDVMICKDIISWGRGKYKNKEEAVKVLKDHYGVGLYKTFDRIFTELGFSESDYIGSGDIAFVQVSNLDPEAAKLFDHITMMVGVDDNGTLIGPGEKGLMLVKDYLLVKSWTL